MFTKLKIGVKEHSRITADYGDFKLNGDLG